MIVQLGGRKEGLSQTGIGSIHLRADRESWLPHVLSFLR